MKFKQLFLKLRQGLGSLFQKGPVRRLRKRRKRQLEGRAPSHQERLLAPADTEPADLQKGKKKGQKKGAFAKAKLPVPQQKISARGALSEFSEVQLSPHTKKAYRRDLEDFFSYLRVHGLLENWNEELTPVHIAQYRSYLSEERKLAKATVTRKLAVLKSFFRWALARQWIVQNPAELVRGFPQTQESKTLFLSDQEVDTLLAFLNRLPQERLFFVLARAVVETLLMLGLRRAEAARIRFEDLEILEGRWLIRIRGKGDRDRKLPIPEKLLETWELWIRRRNQAAGEYTPDGDFESEAAAWWDWFQRRKEEALFISTRARNFETALSDSEIAHIVRKMCRKAGVVSRISPHVLRATAITHALDQGASHRGVQQMAGWTSPLMISRYDKRRKDPKFSAVLNLRYAQKRGGSEAIERAQDKINQEFSSEKRSDTTAPA